MLVESSYKVKFMKIYVVAISEIVMSINLIYEKLGCATGTPKCDGQR